MITLKSLGALSNFAVVAIALAPPALLYGVMKPAPKSDPAGGCSMLPNCGRCFPNTCTMPPSTCTTTGYYVAKSCIDWDHVYPGHCANVPGETRHCIDGDDEELCDVVDCCNGSTITPYIPCTSWEQC